MNIPLLVMDRTARQKLKKEKEDTAGSPHPTSQMLPTLYPTTAARTLLSRAHMHNGPDCRPHLLGHERGPTKCKQTEVIEVSFLLTTE